jgi:hypothetical protein
VPPEEPLGNDLMAAKIFDWVTERLKLSFGGRMRLSELHRGCLARSLSAVSILGGAGTSSEHTNRTAAFRLPCSILEDTAAAKTSERLLEGRLLGSGGTSPDGPLKALTRFFISFVMFVIS